MPVKKRSASPALIGQPSVYHPSVTLFTLETLQAANDSAETTPRRSKRVKTSKVEYYESDTDELGRAATRPSSSGTKARGASRSPTKAKLHGESPRKSGKNASPRKVKPIPQVLNNPHPAPARWREVYDTICDMRSQIVAPVDTMGAGAAQLGETLPENQRFSTLVSLMLSSQTKDEVTSAAVRTLRAAVGGSLSVEAILKADEKTISDAICKVGFWRRKTDYIKRTAERLHDDFNSDVPKTVDELCSLPGVGPKMAFLVLHVAWKVNAGIGVDVHVHRVTNRLGWHNSPTKTPEETRLNLQSWLPAELRPTFTKLLVGFGQTVCLPVGPRCGSCKLSDGLCPSARKAAETSTSKVAVMGSPGRPGPKIEIVVEEEDKKFLDPDSASS